MKTDFNFAAEIPKDFLLSSDQCRIIFQLDSSGSIKLAAQALNRDISVLSRQIAQISEIAPVVEKINGRWRVSKLGKKISAWSGEAILTQQRILSHQEHLTVATTGEFSSRVLAPRLEEVFGNTDELGVTILVPGKTLEEVILNGEADIAIGCGTPHDPSVKFHKVIKEPFLIVASPKLIKKKHITQLSQLVELPYLKHIQLDANKYLGLSKDSLTIKATFNQIAGIRSACVAGLGWALLPRYAVQAEFDRKELCVIGVEFEPQTEKDHYGVWWLRERRGLEPWVRKLVDWLKC